MRVKLLGIRSDVGAMYAIGSIKEDYLGFVIPSTNHRHLLTRLAVFRRPKYKQEALLQVAKPSWAQKCAIFHHGTQKHTDLAWKVIRVVWV